MNFTFLRLAVLIILQLAGVAQAATLNFNGGAVAGCTYSGQTYSCATLPLVNWNDSVVIAGGYTVVVSSNVAIGYNQSLQMSGGARLQTSGNASLDLSQINPSLLNASGTFAAGGNFLLGAGTVTGTVTAGGQATVATGGTIAGPLTAASLQTGSSVTISGTVAVSGVLGLGSGNTIGGAVSGASISTSSNIAFGSSLTVTGAIDLGSGNTISGAVSGASITSNANVSMGSLSVTGAANLGSNVQITGSLVAGTVETNANVQIGGAVTSAGTVDFGSGVTVGGAVSGTTITTSSQVTIGGNVTATTSFDIGSGGAVTGNITAPVVALRPAHVTVNGNIMASTSLEAGSGTTITGNISGGSLTLRPSNVTINGNATFTGDVDMGSGDTINGDLSARNVTTRASNATINGNAAVNAIYLDWGATVTKTITCTGAAPGDPVCSCVTKADSNYHPTCGAPAQGGAHHIRITHSGQGLTCQAQTVTLTACADANCSSTYNGNTNVTLLPGGGPAFNFNGSTTATVRYPTATDNNGTPLSAAVNGITNANICPNASTGTNNCNMVFKDNGLLVTAPDHVAMTDATLTVQALTSAPGGGTCLPLVKDATVQVNFSCSYMNPSSGAASSPVIIDGINVSCGSGTTGIQLKFDNTGLASSKLQYAEVGQVSVKAAYTGSGGNANLGASGSDDFIAAPAGFKIEATRVNGGSFAPGVFGNPGDLFTLKVSAVNAATAVTTNFGKETAAESFKIDPVLKFPTGGLMPITSGKFDTISGGIGNSQTGTNGQWHFDEVGTLTLNAKLVNQSTYYMGKGIKEFATAGTLDLRFVPHHFNTTLVAGTPMDCVKLGGANPCEPSNTSGKFIYSKQPFDMRVTAYNDVASTSVSQNYVDLVDQDTTTVARPITVSLWTTSGGGTAAVFNGGGFTPGVKFSFAKGVGTVTGSVLPAISFNYNLPDSQILPTTVFVRAIDDDLVSSKRDSAVEAALTVVSGRMQVTNNYGSANSPLPVKVQAQYYSRTASAYVFNSQFPATYSAAEATFTIDQNISYRNCQKQLAVNGNTCPEPAAAGVLIRPHNGVLSFKDGNASFLLAAPKVSGSVDVRLESKDWTPSLPSPIPFLPSTEYGRETFGIYRSGPVIYTREVHN